MAREPATIKRITSNGFPGTVGNTTLPNRIIHPTDWFPMANAGQQKMVDSFVEDLESYLGVPSTRLSLREEWKGSGPLPHRLQTLDEYMEHVS